jgi:hypothetical protein
MNAERPKSAAEQARDLFEPAAAALTEPPRGTVLSEAALCSIAISLRRLADAGIFSMGALIGNRARTMSVRDAAEVAVAAERETWEAAIRLAGERKRKD